jgi:L-seryl-tRNA(Ser) seleniumtransferase
MGYEFEHQNRLNGRRSFMKLLAAAPLFATIGTRSVAAAVSNAVASTVKRSYTDNIYTRIGVKPLINARGTWTYLCGSLEIPATRQAVEDASHYFVDMFELQAGIGRQLAKLSGAESGMITSGSAGAIASATAGCIAGTDPNHVWQLPDTTGLKNEVIIMPRRSAFDSAIRLAGGKLVVAMQWRNCRQPLRRKPPCCTPIGRTTNPFRGYSESPSPPVYPSWWTSRTAFLPFRTSRTTQR